FGLLSPVISSRFPNPTLFRSVRKLLPFFGISIKVYIVAIQITGFISCCKQSGSCFQVFDDTFINDFLAIVFWSQVFVRLVSHQRDRKSTRLNSSPLKTSYAVV